MNYKKLIFLNSMEGKTTGEIKKEAKKAVDQFNSHLICVHKGCKTPQNADGEYCNKHYPKK